MTAASSEQILLVGIGGPSSGGKTTLARLLLQVFQGGGAATDVGAFIIHEDDFYKPDDKIPLVKLPSGEEVADWDVTDAINLVDLRNALAHVRQHGCLPPTHRSKEDLNQQTDAGVAASDIARLRDDARARLDTVLQGRRLTLPILEGFLLFAPPGDQTHPLRPIDDLIDAPFFLPVTRSLLKKRRADRGGYVTIGPSDDAAPAKETAAPRSLPLQGFEELPRGV